MFKKLLIIIIALAPLAAVAQDVKIAYLNAQEIFSAMPELPGIETKLTTKQEEINKNGQALVDEFNKKAEEFDKTPAGSEAIQQDRQKQLSQIQERYQVYLQNSQQEMGQLQQQLLEPVNKKIADAIKSVGDENNYTYIFDISTMQSPIVYVNSTTAVNITQQVKTKLGLK
ncbi:MAG: OmpH family outer membrane protein [Proteiniphilum sp.]|nr:OmpH family outer membrane protein [Proteiniphilum sp.]MDD3909119.1 OmpH family outer membrane protein [Proteiniphilum sp.]MDD4416530.1 OmpH family outer membrane protein [Proteiniphilum sp.]